MDIKSESIKAVIDKNAQSILKKFGDIAKDEWEKIKIDLSVVFTRYIENSYEKYSKIKTILYRTEPKYIYDFFEYPTLSKGNDCNIPSDDINELLKISHYLIISGTGGIGKSTFMKHLFINVLSKNVLIPIFLELKDINEYPNELSIKDFIFNKLTNLGSELKNEYLEYALKSGCFLFLFDGYDEITFEKRDMFYRELTDFSDMYPDNYFIISSRPYSEFLELQRYTVLSLCLFSKEQAISLIGKIDYDEAIKSRFIKALDEKLYSSHYSFASNPLLLNIMLLTYDNYADIPEKLHLFYENAFETLYSKHDATKGGYRRELKSGLSFDSFKKTFAYFCFITYYNGKIVLTYDELVQYLKKSKPRGIDFNIDDMIDDLINAVCVLYKDGLQYRFSHRSFQEYFTSLFLKELSDENLEKMSLSLISKDWYHATHDSIFTMLFDMCREKTEQHVFMPILNIIEKDATGDKYQLYFQRIHPIIMFDYVQHGDKKYEEMFINMNQSDAYMQFMRNSTYIYLGYSSTAPDKSEIALYDYISKKYDYTIDMDFDLTAYPEDEQLQTLIKNTWLGKSIVFLSNMKETLTKTKQNDDLDLNSLLV